jgi:hypothetical protein
VCVRIPIQDMDFYRHMALAIFAAEWFLVVIVFVETFSSNEV